jgi:hypothetical protein
MFRDLERGQRALEGIAAHRSMRINLAHDEQTRSGGAMLVSGGYFGLLRLRRCSTIATGASRSAPRPTWWGAA